MKVDRSFDGFFCSLWTGVVGSTVIVSVGKALSDNYFILTVLFLLSVVATLSYLDKQRRPSKPYHIINMFEDELAPILEDDVFKNREIPPKKSKKHSVFRLKHKKVRLRSSCRRRTSSMTNLSALRRRRGDVKESDMDVKKCKPEGGDEKKFGKKRKNRSNINKQQIL